MSALSSINIELLRSSNLVEDGIAEGLQNWFKTLIHLYVELIEPQTKKDTQALLTDDAFIEGEKALREQRLNTIYTVSFYIDSFFSMASAIIELQKFTRYLRVSLHNHLNAPCVMYHDCFSRKFHQP